ncbi:hypothetical protein KIPB_000956 [Kipferlia bialata]|uniref:Fungal lipase-type domain-containing protein n=1 Tax=Kipferlia bialata TaxID=797122 RepID=A0A9K3CPZ4_9EUKA|nr:hypothetical protein KIPB_000956 [Kipferlia bialata]|eukprot:g956.t1
MQDLVCTCVAADVVTVVSRAAPHLPPVLSVYGHSALVSACVTTVNMGRVPHTYSHSAMGSVPVLGRSVLPVRDVHCIGVGAIRVQGGEECCVLGIASSVGGGESQSRSEDTEVEGYVERERDPSVSLMLMLIRPDGTTSMLLNTCPFPQARTMLGVGPDEGLVQHIVRYMWGEVVYPEVVYPEVPGVISQTESQYGVSASPTQFHTARNPPTQSVPMTQSQYYRTPTTPRYGTQGTGFGQIPPSIPMPQSTYPQVRYPLPYRSVAGGYPTQGSTQSESVSQSGPEPGLYMSVFRISEDDRAFDLLRAEGRGGDPTLVVHQMQTGGYKDMQQVVGPGHTNIHKRLGSLDDQNDPNSGIRMLQRAVTMRDSRPLHNSGAARSHTVYVFRHMKNALELAQRCMGAWARPSVQSRRDPVQQTPGAPRGQAPSGDHVVPTGIGRGTPQTQNGSLSVSERAAFNELELHVAKLKGERLGLLQQRDSALKECLGLKQQRDSDVKALAALQAEVNSQTQKVSEGKAREDGLRETLAMERQQSQILLGEATTRADQADASVTELRRQFERERVELQRQLTEQKGKVRSINIASQELFLEHQKTLGDMERDTGSTTQCRSPSSPPAKRGMPDVSECDGVRHKGVQTERERQTERETQTHTDREMESDAEREGDREDETVGEREGESITEKESEGQSQTETERETASEREREVVPPGAVSPEPSQSQDTHPSFQRVQVTTPLIPTPRAGSQSELDLFEGMSLSPSASPILQKGRADDVSARQRAIDRDSPMSQESEVVCTQAEGEGDTEMSSEESEVCREAHEESEREDAPGFVMPSVDKGSLARLARRAVTNTLNKDRPGREESSQIVCDDPGKVWRDRVGLRDADDFGEKLKQLKGFFADNKTWPVTADKDVGPFLAKMRVKRDTGKLSKKECDALRAIGYRDASLPHMVDALCEYFDKHKAWPKEGNTRFKSFVPGIRELYKQGSDSLPSECSDKLDKRGFVWDPKAQEWMERAEALKTHWVKTGLWPTQEEDNHLYVWLDVQRERFHKELRDEELEEYQIKFLNGIDPSWTSVDVTATAPRVALPRDQPTLAQSGVPPPETATGAEGDDGERERTMAKDTVAQLPNDRKLFNDNQFEENSFVDVLGPRLNSLGIYSAEIARQLAYVTSFVGCPLTDWDVAMRERLSLAQNTAYALTDGNKYSCECGMASADINGTQTLILAFAPHRQRYTQVLKRLSRGRARKCLKKATSFDYVEGYTKDVQLHSKLLAQFHEMAPSIRQWVYDTIGLPYNVVGGDQPRAADPVDSSVPRVEMEGEEVTAQGEAVTEAEGEQQQEEREEEREEPNPAARQRGAPIRLVNSETGKPFTIILTGHSFGACLAQMMAVELGHCYHKSAVTLYTFGQPKTGNAEWCRLVPHLCPRFFRVVQARDAVPHLPASSIGFTHVKGSKVRYQGVTDRSTMTQYKIGPTVGFFQRISQHTSKSKQGDNSDYDLHASYMGVHLPMQRSRKDTDNRNIMTGEMVEACRDLSDESTATLSQDIQEGFPNDDKTRVEQQLRDMPQHRQAAAPRLHREEPEAEAEAAAEEAEASVTEPMEAIESSLQEATREQEEIPTTSARLDVEPSSQKDTVEGEPSAIGTGIGHWM